MVYVYNSNHNARLTFRIITFDPPPQANPNPQMGRSRIGRGWGSGYFDIGFTVKRWPIEQKSEWSISKSLCNPAHHWVGPKPGKRGRLASGRESGRKRSAPKPPGMKFQVMEWMCPARLTVLKSLKDLRLQISWTKKSGHWSKRIGGAWLGGKRPTCA